MPTPEEIRRAAIERLGIPENALDAFPVSEQGRLINPDYIQAEGQRIQESLAAGANLTQTVNGISPAVAPQITVAPNSGARDWQFVAPQSIWDQNLSPWQQRENLELDTLRTVAAQRKFDLERAQATAPLEDRLREAQINASGAHDRFMREQDTQYLNAAGGFLNDLSAEGAPRPGTPGWRDHVIGSLKRNGAILKTDAGKGIMKALVEGDNVDEAIAGVVGKAPQGTSLSSVSVDSRGRPTATFKPMDADADLEKAAKDYGLTLGRVRNPIGAEVGRRGEGGSFVGDEAGDIVRVEDEEGRKIAIPMKEYLRLGGVLSPEGAARQSAAPAADLTALAQKALTDPNAPENVKAAARKRLGL